jgi:hypothetical protein
MQAAGAISQCPTIMDRYMQLRYDILKCNRNSVISFIRSLKEACFCFTCYTKEVSLGGKATTS